METKPAVEIIRGRPEQKASAQRRHALLQGRLWAALTSWAGDRGEVGTEWRFYLLQSGDKPSSLVPDVAYVSFERMPPELGELREKPTIAPDIAVEILSPDDRETIIEEKIALYLSYGTRLVIVVDPRERSIVFHEGNGVGRFSGDDIAVSSEFSDLRIDLTELFKRI